MVLGELSATALQPSPVVLSRIMGAVPLPDGTKAANEAAADAVRKAMNPGIHVWPLVALVGLIAIIYNSRVRRG